MDIIGHSGTPAFRYDYESVIPAFGRSGKIVEINETTFRARSASVENCRRIAELCKEHAVRIVLDSDAHFHGQVGRMPRCLELLREIDFPPELVVNGSEEAFSPFFERKAPNPLKSSQPGALPRTYLKLGGLSHVYNRHRPRRNQYQGGCRGQRLPYRRHGQMQNGAAPVGGGHRRRHGPHGQEAAADAGIRMEEVAYVGIGSPGTCNEETGIVEYANNLRFENVPLRQMMHDRLGLDIYIENDANAAALGEALAGAAKGTQSCVCITLGTGVGGGIIIDGKIYGGFNFAGAELGHIVINVDGELCTCGRHGCWEAYASATALIRQTRQAMVANPDSAMWRIAGTLDKVDGRTAFDAMRAGDVVGKRSWTAISNISPAA